MRRFQWMVAAMFSLATVSISTASTLGLDVTSNTTVAFPGEYDNAGWQFSVNAPVTVDGLGFFDVNPTGLGQGHQVGKGYPGFAAADFGVARPDAVADFVKQCDQFSAFHVCSRMR